jgi:transposase
MDHYVGIDLHSTNSYIAIIDNDNKKVFKKKTKNDLRLVEQILKPYQEQIKGIVVESTYNWYWLVDGLIEEGYRMHLANPSAIKYIYPKEERPVRDLLRKRLQLVQQRTLQILSFQNLVARNLGKGMNGNDVKKLSEDDVEQLFGDEHLVVAGKASIATIVFLSDRIRQIEKIIPSIRLQNSKMSTGC